MEVDGFYDDEGETSGAMGGLVHASGPSSRWNPTREQIVILEGMYKQGIRTPTAEQIQQITERLRAYSHIEGKNVFYWFQNHKARQRQRQKQENLALLSRYFYRHRSQPHLSSAVSLTGASASSSSSPNVICGRPHMRPSKHEGLYPTHPRVDVPAYGGVNKRRQTVELLQGMDVHRERSVPIPAHYWQDYNNRYNTVKRSIETDQYALNDCKATPRTLDLFPLHPMNGRSASSCSRSPDSFGVQEVGLKKARPYFDFFSEKTNQ
ncbi:hypothetical protein SAY87_005285 [Trapa incisa]|uniref:Homeobox domain-containing protein n=1 Tax=Trapa incisa TaxID=236973 RepID=A0AAN7K663_9MYRT|nr:hypothetical protein SAY87_005285 [Trapa incisa]